MSRPDAPTTDPLTPTGAQAGPDPDYKPYDRSRLSYASTFTNPWSSRVIRTMEWLTGKPRLLRLIRKFEREGVEHGQGFWPHALQVMGIDLQTPAEQVANIPRTGPVVVVANHPHGLVDGMVLAALIGQRRLDYRILTRSLLTGVPEIERFMIPVPFPHEDEARERMLEMRRAATRQLAADGVVALFPSGSVAASETWWGPPVEAPWNAFTAKLIRTSGATIVPIHFQGGNSRAYQIANQVSATLRQGLLLHEVVHALHRPQAPIVRAPLTPEMWQPQSGNATAFMAWLRAKTLGEI